MRELLPTRDNMRRPFGVYIAQKSDATKGLIFKILN